MSDTGKERTMADEYASNEDLIGDHGSDRAPLMAMTATPPPVPDHRCGDPFAEDSTLLLCQLAPAHAGPHEWREGDEGYIWPNRAQPAPTPSGDDARWGEALAAWVANPVARSVYRDPSDLNDPVVAAAYRDFERGFKAGAAALQEARDALEREIEAGNRRMEALAESRDAAHNDALAAEARLQALQEEANTTARWAREAEAALRQERERLREVEGVLNVVRVWATAAPHDPEEEADLENAAKRALLHFDVTQAAASRPVPAAPTPVVYGRVDVSAAAAGVPNLAPAATPSTDEEGRA